MSAPVLVITADPPAKKEVFRQLRYPTPPEKVLDEEDSTAADVMSDLLKAVV